MIIAKPIGGLGNQMFGYAAAFALAKRLNETLQIDKSLLEGYGTWPYQLDHLAIPQNIAPPTLLDSVVPSRLQRFITRRPSFLRYKEPHFHYDPDFEKLSGTVELSGYFQSWRYFDGAEEELRTLFRPKDDLSAGARNYADRISAASCAVSLHVRRGDYLSAHAVQVHGFPGTEYYRRAVRLIQALHPGATFFVFSDDPVWVEAELLPELDAVLIDGQQDMPWEDMKLMSLCQHNIIANSSFSWWAAWLNSFPDKTVIAPRQWFSPGTMRGNNVCDLYPEGWVLQ